MRIAAEQYGFSDFRKPYEGERMAPPRAKAATNGARFDSIKHAGMDVPVLRDEATGQVVIQSVCAPVGITSRVRPKMGQALPASNPMPGYQVAAATAQRTVPLDDNPNG